MRKKVSYLLAAVLCLAVMSPAPLRRGPGHRRTSPNPGSLSVPGWAGRGNSPHGRYPSSCRTSSSPPLLWVPMAWEAWRRMDCRMPLSKVPAVAASRIRLSVALIYCWTL